MSIINQLIADALIDLGKLSPSETINVHDLTHGIRVANRLFGQWATENLLIPYTASDSFSTTDGDASYLCGSGGSITTRLLRLIDECYINDGAYDYPLKVITQREYNNIFDKTIKGVPYYIYYDPTSYNTGYIRLYKTPDSTYTVYVESVKYLQDTLAAGDTVTLPAMYEDFIVLGLRNRLAGSYGLPVTQDMRLEYIQAERRIKNLNLDNRSMVMSIPPEFSGRGRGGTIEEG
jgi:hypothetical protein